MSDSIIDLLKQAVPKDALGKMGGMLGQPADKTSSAFEAAAGAILGGLIKKVSSPGGAGEIFNSAAKQDGSILDNLGNVLGGGEATQKFEKAGGGILDLIFGSNAAKGGMVAAIAKFLGLNEDLVAKVLKMAAPIVMGVIAKYIKQKKLDAAGLGNFLMSQKGNVKSFLPAGLTSQLGFSDLLGGATSAAKNVGATAAKAGQAASNSAADAANAGGSLLKMLIPIIIIGLLAWLAYTYLAKPTGDAAGKAAGKIGTGIAAGSKAVGDVDFGDFDMAGLTAQFTGITQGLKDVTTDNVSPLADKISGLTKSLGEMGFDKLAGPAKTAVTTAISGFTESVENQLAGISDAGILAILKPVIDALMQKIKSLGF
jgi:hypothetical protein